MEVDKTSLQSKGEFVFFSLFMDRCVKFCTLQLICDTNIYLFICTFAVDLLTIKGFFKI